MIRMRSVVKERNVYRWAGTLIGDLCDVRLTHAGSLKRAETSTPTAVGAEEEIIREYPVQDFGHAKAMGTGSHNVGG